MATIRNPTPFNLFSVVLGRSVAGEEIVDGLTDGQAEAACASGIFERGVLVIPEEITVTVTNDEEDDEEKPKRPVGRPKSVRGAVEVEEVTDADRETR